MNNYKAIFAILIMGFVIPLSGQNIRNANNAVTFSSRLHSPIEINVDRDDDRYVFSATNRSGYEYEVEITFTTLTNLDPYITKQLFVLRPGANKLFTLKKKNPEISPKYSYIVEYSIGNSSKKADFGFPYLLPIAEGKQIEIAEGASRLNNIFNQCYAVSFGDTIYAARNGYVMAIPGGYELEDRIASKSSLEVRHLDGTVAIYNGINPEDCFTDIRSKVFAGQPIGTAYSKWLWFTVFSFSGPAQLTTIDNFFAAGEDKTIHSSKTNGWLVVHPEKIKERELSKSELRRKKKGLLYK